MILSSGIETKAGLCDSSEPRVVPFCLQHEVAQSPRHRRRGLSMHSCVKQHRLNGRDNPALRHLGANPTIRTRRRSPRTYFVSCDEATYSCIHFKAGLSVPFFLTR